MVSPWQSVLTDRLDLRPVSADDVPELFAITSDPRTYRHEPRSRHADLDVTRAWVERAAARWRTDGLSYWCVRLVADGSVVGLGGVQRQSTGAWNLHYRLAPEQWGRGYATEVGRAGVDAAHAADGTVPVIAWILPTNEESVRVARRLGLLPQGLHADPSDGTARLAFTDREVDPDVWSSGR